MQNEISVIVPVFNEAESFETLLDELLSVLSKLEKTYEVIFVDDCSTDGTTELIRKAEGLNPSIKGIYLRINTKKCGALRQGILHSTAPIIITMDGDLQDDPAEIPSLLREINNGADVVIGWKKNRKDGPGKRIPSRIINFLCSASFDIKLHDMNSGLKAMKRDAALSAPLFDSLYRYMAHFLAAEGFVVREVPVLHRQRSFGKSKFGWLHRLQGIQDFIFVLLLVGFRRKRFFLWVIMLSFMAIGLLGMSLAVGSLLHTPHQSTVFLLFCAFTGLILFLFGVRTIIVYTIYKERVLSMDRHA